MPLLTSLTFTPSLQIKNKQIKNLDEYLHLILDALKITDVDMINRIKKPFEDNKAEAYRLLSDPTVITKITSLLEADVVLNNLVSDTGELHEYYSDIKDNWNNTMESLATLQGLIIIRKTKKGCGPTIEKLILALAQKIDASNSLLELEL